MGKLLFALCKNALTLPILSEPQRSPTKKSIVEHEMASRHTSGQRGGRDTCPWHVLRTSNVLRTCLCEDTCVLCVLLILKCVHGVSWRRFLAQAAAAANVTSRPWRSQRCCHIALLVGTETALARSLRTCPFCRVGRVGGTLL